MSEPGFTKVAELEKDQVFGELALIKNQPRAATILAKKRSFFAVLDRQTYKRVLMKIEQKRLNKAVGFLHSLPFFKSWTRSTISKFQYFFTRQEFSRNHVVFKEGDPIDYIYLIFSGEFELSMKQRSQVKREVDLGSYLSLDKLEARNETDVSCSSSHIERLVSKPKPVNEVIKRVHSVKVRAYDI